MGDAIIPAAITDQISALLEDALAHAPTEEMRPVLAACLMVHVAMRLRGDLPDLAGQLRLIAEGFDA